MSMQVLVVLDHPRNARHRLQHGGASCPCVVCWHTHSIHDAAPGENMPHCVLQSKKWEASEESERCEKSYE